MSVIIRDNRLQVVGSAAPVDQLNFTQVVAPLQEHDYIKLSGIDYSRVRQLHESLTPFDISEFTPLYSGLGTIVSLQTEDLRTATIEIRSTRGQFTRKDPWTIPVVVPASLPRSIPARKMAILGDLSDTGEMFHCESLTETITSPDTGIIYHYCGVSDGIAYYRTKEQMNVITKLQNTVYDPVYDPNYDPDKEELSMIEEVEG